LHEQLWCCPKHGNFGMRRLDFNLGKPYWIFEDGTEA